MNINDLHVCPVNEHTITLSIICTVENNRPRVCPRSIDGIPVCPGVQAWELGEALDPRRLDTTRYCSLLDRAMRTVLDPCKSLQAPAQLLC